MKRWSMLFLLAWLCSALASGSAADTKITKKQIPAPVLSAFQGTYPNAKIKGQSIETENGKKYYEIESTEGTTRRDLLYTPEGKVYEIEETADPASLPANLKNTVAKEYPKGKITKAEKVTAQDSTVTYEVQIKSGKKTKAVSFDASGDLLKPSKKSGEKEKGEAEEKGEKED